MEISPNQYFIGQSGTNSGPINYDQAGTRSKFDDRSEAARQAYKQAISGNAEDLDLTAVLNRKERLDAERQSANRTHLFLDIARTGKDQLPRFIDTYA